MKAISFCFAGIASIAAPAFALSGCGNSLDVGDDWANESVAANGFRHVPLPGGRKCARVVGSSEHDLWCARGAELHHWNGSAWSDKSSSGAFDMEESIAAAGPNAIWAIGGDHATGDPILGRITLDREPVLYKLPAHDGPATADSSHRLATGGGDVVILGLDSGILFWLDGDVLARAPENVRLQPVPARAPVVRISNRNNVWVVQPSVVSPLPDDHAFIAHFDGSTWASNADSSGSGSGTVVDDTGLWTFFMGFFDDFEGGLRPGGGRFQQYSARTATGDRVSDALGGMIAFGIVKSDRGAITAVGCNSNGRVEAYEWNGREAHKREGMPSVRCPSIGGMPNDGIHEPLLDGVWVVQGHDALVLIRP